MPDFKELIKDLYTTKGRDLTEEKLSYIETNYGKGKEEEFIKDFYATIGEELPQEKFDYIRDTYLKKKEDGGIPYRTPSAPVAPSFGTPSVVEASEQLESQSKLTPPQKGGVGKLDLSKGVPVKPLSGDMPIGQLKVEKDLQRIQQSVPKVGRETMYRNAIKSNENKARLAEEKMLQIQPLLQEVDNIQQAGGEVPQELANQYNNALPTYNALLEQRNKSIDNIEYFNNALEGNRQLEIGLTDSGFRSRFVNQGLDNLGSLLYNSIAGTARMLKGATPPHLAVQAELAEKIAQRAGNKAAARAEYSTALMDEKDNYLGKEIGQIFDEKGLSGATEYALKKFTESLPITLGIMGASATGTGGAIIANTALFGGSANQKYEELKDRTDMTEEQKTFNAIGYGGAELLFEGVLSSGMGVVYKQMIKSMGKEAAEKAIKKNLVDLITNGVKKYMPLSGAVVEGVGEGATQLTQNIIDKYTDPTKKDMDVMSGVADATAIGFAGGGAMASPTLLTYVNRSKNVEKNKEIEKKREAIQTELSKPVSEATKEILQDTDNKLMQEQNELVIEDVKDLTEKLPEEQKEEVKGLAEDRRQIEQAISETESEEVKSELENKSKQIGEQIDNIYERAKEPISRGTDVNKEGLGVAVETGAQGVEGEGVSGAEVEATTKALERVDESKLISGNDVWGNATNAGSENNDFIENMEEYESQIKGRQYLKVPISIDLLRANDKDLNEYLNDIDTSAKKRKIETPIIVGDAERGAFETTKDGVIDGFHRTEQAIINGEKNIIAFVPINSKILSEAYHKAKVEGSNPELVKAVETLINKEYATQKIKQPKGVRTEPKGGIKGGETKTPSVSDSVQRTKESEKEREVRGEKPPTPEERARQVEILDTEKKIAQLEKDMRTAPVKPRRGVASQKQIRIQIRNYKDQLRELKGLPPRRKPTDSVLRRNLRAFSTQVDENNLPHEERVVLDAIGRLSATDRDIVNLDGNAKLRNQNALKKTGGDSIDLIVSDYINENDLDSEMAGDLRDAIISFVSKGDVYAFLNRIKEREAQTDPDAIREDEYYNYGYGVAEELFLTDEEVSQLEYEIGELQDLTQEEYEQLKKQFTEESLGEAGERTDIAEGKTTIGEKKPIAGNRIFNEPLKGVKEIADRYFQRVFGKQRPSFKGITKLDKKRAKRISDAFIAMKNEPNNPLVKEAYEAMAKETLEQYKDFLEAGYVVEINNKEPYNSSQEMIEDLRENKRIKIYSTESGFGNIKITDKQREENPLLRDSGYKDVNGKPLLVNDVFRAIHDFFGHSELGNGFGAIGEENAWNIHARMYSPIARRAMTTETRGQNSFVNFSGINDEIKSLRDKARELRKQGKNKEAQEIVDKIFEEGAFAEQKMGLLPEEFSQIEGVEEEVTPEAQVAEVAQKTGITPKNLRDLYKINRELFGLDRIKSLASAVAMDRMVGAMAKRAGVTKEQMYGRLKFEKDTESNVLKADNALFQGMVDGKPVTLRNMDVDVVNGFYSPIEKNVKEYGKDKIKAKDWLNVVGKGDEAVFTGVRAFLESKDPNSMVSKQEILDYMKENRISVVEVVKEETPSVKDSDLRVRFDGNGFTIDVNKKGISGVYIGLDELDVDYNGENYEEVETAAIQEGLSQIRGGKQGDETKFSQYQLEGDKENYKEVLVTLPSNNETQKSLDIAFKEKGYVMTSNGNIYPKTIAGYADVNNYPDGVSLNSLPTDVQKIANKLKGTIGGKDFKSSHFDEPNILVHLRMNTRYSSKENKDYLDPKTHKPNFDEGFELIDNGDNYQVKKIGSSSPYFNTYSKKTMSDNNMSINDLKEYLMAYDRLGKLHPDFADNKKSVPVKVLFLEEIQSDWGQKGKKEGFDDKVLEKRRNELLEESYQIERKENDNIITKKVGNTGNISDFEVSYKDENLKKQLAKRKAEIENEINEINKKTGITPTAPFVTDTNAWTKLGLKMAMREAVAQGVDKIAWTTGEQQNARYDLSKQVDEITYKKLDNGDYRVVVYKDGNALQRQDLKEDELESNFGKDVAERIINDKGDKNELTGVNSLSGINLSVGGKGMKGFYGSMEEGTKGIVGGVAEKLFGQKVGKTRILSTSAKIDKTFSIENRQNEPFGRTWLVVDENGSVYGRHKTESEAEDDAQRLYDGLFEIEKRGYSTQPSIDITPALRAEVERGLALFQRQQGQQAKGAMVAADGAFVIYALTDPNVSTPLHEMAHVFEHYLTDAERVAVQNWAGTKAWTTQTSEAFARGFEKYLSEGKAPTPALQKIFEKFKEWLTDIYNGIKGSEIDIELNEQMREIYAKMLGAEAVTPTKVERKAIASAKIDEIANALKDILPKIEGEKLGVGQDEIIDVIAKAVKTLVNAGIEINEAIKQVKARLSEAFDGVEGISDTDIKDRMKVTERLTPKSREEQNQKAQSYGFKNASHALNSVNKETGETYETFESIPDSVLEEVGKEKVKPETPKGKRRFTQQFIKQYPELAEMLSEDIVNYAKMPNNISVDMANAFIEEVGLEEARAAFADMSSGLPSGARMTLGQLVIKKLEEAGRVDEAIDVLEQVTTRATEMGQEIQALSMWAFLTPQGQLRYAQKTVNKAVERRKKQDKSKTDKLKEKLKKANQEAVDETLQDPKVRGLIEKTDSIIPKGLPTPETKKPKKYIVSDDRVALLKKQIKGKLFSGIPTELIELGVAYVERGAYKFSDFSRAMIKEFGNKIKPYLKEVYTKATETLIKEDYDKSNFDSADNIDKQVAQQKADEAVEKVEKAIKAGNKKALAQAIANLQKVAKQNGLWGQYKKYAVSRLKQLTIQNISDDVKKNPPLDEFTKGLVQNIKSMMMEKAEPKEREKIAKRPAIEVIADAFKNPEAYKEVLEETQKEMRKKYKDDVESLEMLDEYFGEFFDKPFSSKLVGTAIKEAMKEMNITISDIVTSHYTVYDATKKSLVDKLVEQAGLSESEASVLAKAIEKEFDKIATEKKQKLLEKILSNKKRKTPEAKSLEQELIRLTNLGAFSDSDVMSKWAEKMGYPKLTQEQVKEIQKLADAVQRAGKGFERFRAIEDLLSYQANLKGVSQLDVAISIWYANILSGFTTQTINTVANLLNAATLYANAVAQNPKNAKFIASGFIEGFKRGLIEAKETFRTGYSPIRGKVEVPPVLERVKFEGFSKPLEYAKLIGRLMKAADVLVFEALKEMRAYQLAAKQSAKTSALEPSQSIKDKAAEMLGKSDYMIEEATETTELWYENKVEEINESNLSKEEKEKALKQAKIDKQRKLYEYLEEQRSPEFQSEVADYAARGTYNYKPEGILGWMASAINQAKDKLNIAAEDATNPFQQAAINTAKVFTNAIVPFTNIIANVANESLNYTPVGIARRISGTTALSYNKKELTDQQKADLMTKAVIGNSLMVAIYLLATLPAGDDDEPVIEITANGTGDYRKNYELQADGWQPYSVKVGKKWISYQYTPFMIPLSFIGNIKDYEKYRGEKLTDMAFGNQAAVAFGHTFRTLLDMTALSSLNKFLSASLDPRNENKVEDLLKASEKTATSVVVPNLFTQSAKYIESAFQIPLKETSDQRFGNVLQHIPYVRNKYYDKLNALGEPVMPDTDKFLSTSKDEPIWGLIANKKAFIGKPSIKQMKRIDAETGQERFYTQEEYYNYGAIRGALIKEAIIKDFDKINAMSDKDAQEYIGSIKNEANMIARLAAESGKDEQSRSKIIETTKKSLEKDKAEKAKSEERKKKEEAKMSPQQIKYMNELDAISSKAGKIQYIINLKEKSGTTWYNVKKDIRKVISNDLIKDLKDLEKEGAIPKLGIAIKEKFD
jgi:hypothetical protein